MATQTCLIGDCLQPAVCRGYCSRHYGRLWRHGDPLAGGRPRRSFKSTLVPVDAPTGHKQCTRCGQVFPLKTFHRNPVSQDGRAGQCRDCVSVTGREMRGISEEDARRKPGSTRCECCGDETLGGLVMDHDHATGRFRGWLCHGCNSGVGYLMDDPARCRLAADYLDRTRP